MTRGRFLSDTVSVGHDLDANRIQIPWLPASVNSWRASSLEQRSLCDMAIHQSKNKGEPPDVIISGQQLRLGYLLQVDHRYLLNQFIAAAPFSLFWLVMDNIVFFKCHQLVSMIDLIKKIYTYERTETVGRLSDFLINKIKSVTIMDRKILYVIW